MTSPACSGTVTRPPRVACLSWAWEPLWTTITQPSRPRACTTCRPVTRGRGGIEGIVRGRCDPRAHSHASVARPTVRPIWIDELTTATHTEALSLSAKKPTFEPTNPSQSVARSCTPLQTTRGTAFWTSQNATMRDATDQKVGDSSSSGRASKGPGSGLLEPRGAGGRFARPYKNPYRYRDELDL
jgi:hypothetical protein